MQTRAITGIDFENTIVKEGWIRKEVKPKMIWGVEGNNIIQKMENVEFNVEKFNLSERSQIFKSDFCNIENETLRFEIKKYSKDKLNKWTLYSEPFFKISNRETAQKIDKDIYNRFVSDFVEKRKDIINHVLDNISKGIIGVYCKDGLIPIDDLEFKIEVLEGWKGYNRISVMFKIKG